VLAKFPFTDLTASKRRPAIVVSKEGTKDDVIVAFITSVLPEKLSDTDFLFSPDHADFATSGLTRPSLIKADKLATLNRSILTGELGGLSTEIMKQVDERLKTALGLN